MKVQKKKVRFANCVQFCTDCSFATVSYFCVKVPSEIYSLVRIFCYIVSFRCFLKVHDVLFVVMISYDEHLISRGWQYFDRDLAIKTIYAFR